MAEGILRASGFSRRARLAVICVLTACSSTLVDHEDVRGTLELSMSVVDRRVAKNTEVADFQAYRLSRMIEQVDPTHPGVQDAMETIRGRNQEWVQFFSRPLAGVNFAQRKPVDAGMLAHVAWYLPDRVLDLFDIFSFDVHLGPGLLVDVHATRAVHLPAFGGRLVGGIGWYPQRSLGMQTQAEGTLSFLPMGTSSYSGSRYGTSGQQAISTSLSGLHRPSHELYTYYRDYWALGASVTGVIAGFGFDLHPLQVGDFLAGVVGFDPLNDDFATTTGIPTADDDHDLMRMLSELIRDRATMDAYLIMRAEEVRLGIDV
jgi:hypothetical protein